MRRTKWLAVLIIILAAVLSAVIMQRFTDTSHEAAPASTEPPEPVAEVVIDEDIDYREIIIQAAIDGDTSMGTLAETQMLMADAGTLRYHELVALAKIMQEEAGIDWPDLAVMAIGEIVLNRVASPEFPDNVLAVLGQIDPVQYAPVQSPRWQELHPEERYVRLAARLLDGERVLNNETIVYQALFAQGGKTVMTYTDLVLGSTTYFCTTYHPELY